MPRFWLATAAYVLAVQATLMLSTLTDAGWLFVAAELATLPTAVFLLFGGTTILWLLSDYLTWAGPAPLFAAFNAAALLNALLLRELFQASRRRQKAQPPHHPPPHPPQ